MLNIIDMINANLNTPISKMPEFTNWQELGAEGQALIASLALGLDEDDLKALSAWAASSAPGAAEETLYRELQSFESERNAGRVYINPGSPLSGR